MLIRSIRTASLAVPLFFISACATLTRPATYGLDEGAAALVRQTCTDVMGLHVAVAEYDACGASLADSVRMLNDANLTALANEECERQGLKPGTAALAKCVVLSRRGELRLASAGLVPLPVSKPHNSYFSVSRSKQQEREELSCAHLGLHPASGGFQQCVVSLREAILAAQNPL